MLYVCPSRGMVGGVREASDASLLFIRRASDASCHEPPSQLREEDDVLGQTRCLANTLPSKPSCLEERLASAMAAEVGPCGPAPAEVPGA